MNAEGKQWGAREAQDISNSVQPAAGEQKTRKERENNTLREAPKTNSLFLTCCRGVKASEGGKQNTTYEAQRKALQFPACQGSGRQGKLN